MFADKIVYVKIGAVTLTALVIALLLATGTHYAALTLRTSLTLTNIKDDLVRRASTKGPTDSVASQFRSATGTSGVAALAYLVTRFGDIVFEKDLFLSPSERSRKVDARLLLSLASRLGYHLESKEFQYDDLPKDNMQPVIAIMHDSLFVVVHTAGDTITFYDPSVGQFVNTHEQIFTSRWTGKILRLRLTLKNRALP